MAYKLNTDQQYYDSGENYGGYQFVTLKEIINEFMLIYVGEDKIISKARRLDVAFHAQRALTELSFDTLKSFKSIEITVPTTLQMIIPPDYINYTKISTVDSVGIKHRLYPTKDTSNPLQNPLQDDDGNYKLEKTGAVTNASVTVTISTRAENILVGMQVTGVYIPPNSFVKSVTHATTTTTITLHDGISATANKFATGTGNILLQFSNPTTQGLNYSKITSKPLLKPENAIHVVDTLDWSTGEQEIFANAASDITSLEVGMLVYHEDFPVGTKIASIDSTTIFVDRKALDTETANAGQVTFVDPNKDTDTWANYKSNEPSELQNFDDYEDDLYWRLNGNRYGLEPSHAQVNGSFYINDELGYIYFSSNVSGKTVILDYISDGLGTEEEMKVHKFAQEAMFKHIAYAILSGKADVPEFQVQRFKKERFAETRKAKLRLSNLKLEELTQILRGKSKWIKH